MHESWKGFAGGNGAARDQLVRDAGIRPLDVGLARQAAAPVFPSGRWRKATR